MPPRVAGSPGNFLMSDLQVSTHPLVAHHVCTLRNPATRPSEFRRVVRQLTRLVAVEATASLPTHAVHVPTPLGGAAGRQLTDRIAIVPILRAGLGMADGLLELIPDAEVWHVGLYRDEATLQPKEYYNKLPDHSTVDTCLILDPMLATGGSATAAIEVSDGLALDLGGEDQPRQIRRQDRDGGGRGDHLVWHPAGPVQGLPHQ